jgi:hypothetical protein
MDPSSPDTSKRQKTTHPYLEFDGVIYIDMSPTQAKPSDIVHNMDEETATLVDAQEELAFDDDEEEDFSSNGGENRAVNVNLSASPLTLPQSRRVRLMEDALFPPNWTTDDSTASMPDLDYEEDDDSLIDFVYCKSDESDCVMSQQSNLLNK